MHSSIWQANPQWGEKGGNTTEREKGVLGFMSTEHNVSVWEADVLKERMYALNLENCLCNECVTACLIIKNYTLSQVLTPKQLYLCFAREIHVEVIGNSWAYYAIPVYSRIIYLLDNHKYRLTEYTFLLLRSKVHWNTVFKSY
jgi:hypothetical protein